MKKKFRNGQIIALFHGLTDKKVVHEKSACLYKLGRSFYELEISNKALAFPTVKANKIDLDEWINAPKEDFLDQRDDYKPADKNLACVLYDPYDSTIVFLSDVPTGVGITSSWCNLFLISCTSQLDDIHCDFFEIK